MNNPAPQLNFHKYDDAVFNNNSEIEEIYHSFRKYYTLIERYSISKSQLDIFDAMGDD